jgi:hypothetical protein
MENAREMSVCFADCGFVSCYGTSGEEGTVGEFALAVGGVIDGSKC